MSCRDARAWSALLAHRFAEVPEPAEWPECAAHLASCAPCRQLALAIDPTLLFQRLPEPAAEPASEVEAMREAVASLRRARALTAVAPEDAPARAAVSMRGKWVRAAAAAALVVGLGSQLPFGRRAVEPPVPVAATAPAPELEATVPAEAPGLGGAGTLGVSGDVGRPSARVYQLAYRDMAVVMVVDKSLDL